MPCAACAERATNPGARGHQRMKNVPQVPAAPGYTEPVDRVARQHVPPSDQIMQDCGKLLMGHVPDSARMRLPALQ